MTTSTTGYASSGTALSTGQWYHVAFVRQSGTVKFYLNGTLDYNAGSVTTNITELGGYIGGQNAQYYTNCYVDDLRITKGFARYTANFTPPDAAFQGQ